MCPSLLLEIVAKRCCEIRFQGCVFEEVAWIPSCTCVVREEDYPPPESFRCPAQPTGGAVCACATFKNPRILPDVLCNYGRFNECKRKGYWLILWYLALIFQSVLNN